ncbi:MAG: HD domain-containing protein [Candidatus Micrarchaeaceae archaeon]
MDKRKIIHSISKHVMEKYLDEPTGHDWWHTYRVWKLAVEIAKKEKQADMFVVQLAALLHDIADWKFAGGDIHAGSREARRLLSGKVDDSIIKKVEYIIDNVSFKGAGEKEKMASIEGKIVQDADRLDAMGAIGIARVFAYGGATGRVIHDPRISYKENMKFEDYKANKGTSINHFYEKLLLLKGRMNTKEGKRMAASRHKIMKNFLDEFYKEWDGIK